MEREAKYVQLFAELKRSIDRGEYPVGEKLPGETELSWRYHMSRQTVRQALSLLEQEGMIQRRQGSGTYVKALKTAPKSVGIIATYISEYIFPSILRGMEESLREDGFIPSLFATQNRVEREREILEGLLERQIDGLIVEGTKTALPNPNLALYEEFRKKGIPVVFFNGFYEGLPHSVSVTMDDRAGGRKAVDYLVSKGHRKIGAVLKSDDIQGVKRYEGYLDGLLKHGLSLKDERVIWFHSENRARLFQKGDETTWELKRLSGCTAVVCYNDEAAVKLIGALGERGLSVPEDQSLISFDNSFLSGIGPVRLTSLEHEKESLGAAAAKKLAALTAGHREGSVVFPWRLIEGASVSSPKGSG